MTSFKRVLILGCTLWTSSSALNGALASPADDCLRLDAFRQQNETAEKCTKAIEEAKPPYKNVEKYSIQLGKVFNWVGRPEQALTALNSALERVPNNMEARLERARAYRGLNQLEKAFSEVSEVLANEPKNVVALAEIGLIYNNAGLTENAIAAFKQALDIQPKYHFARLRLGRVYQSQLGDTKQALQQYDTILADPEDILNQSESQEWRDEFDAIPFVAGVRFRRAQAAVQAGQHDKALKDIKWLTKRYPDQPGPYATLANSLSEQKKYKNAIEVAEKVLSYCDKHPYSFIDKCYFGMRIKIKSLFALDRFSELIDVGRTLANTAGHKTIDNADSFFHTGLALKRVGKLDEAREFFIRSMDADPWFVRLVNQKIIQAGFYEGQETDGISEKTFIGLEACMIDDDCLKV